MEILALFSVNEITSVVITHQVSEMQVRCLNPSFGVTVGLVCDFGVGVVNCRESHSNSESWVSLK